MKQSRNPALGVYGIIGSGKSLFAKTLACALDAHYLDVDALGAPAREAKQSEIIVALGADILDEEKRINPRALGEKVFNDTKALHTLEDIIHPVMKRMVAEILAREPRTVIDAALLYRMKLNSFCAQTIYIDAPESACITRVRRRNNLSEAEVRRIIEQQKDIKENRIHADIIVKNVFDETHVTQEATRIAEGLTHV